VHPNIRKLTTRLDIFRNGHAMRRPTPGSLWGGQREKLANFRHPRIALAHADLSGFSLFEEAQYRCGQRNVFSYWWTRVAPDLAGANLVVDWERPDYNRQRCG